MQMKRGINLIDSATFTVDGADTPALHNAVLHIARVGYCEKGVCERLGLSDLTDLLWRAIPIYREEQLAVRDALALTIDLFLLQGTIPLDELNQLFDKAVQDLLVRVGLLLIDEQGLVYARASLFPVGDCLIFSDHAWPMLPHPGCVNVPYDQVMSVGTDSRWLARATVRHPVGAALDLCTGSGIHALLAASHSRRVLAVDINPRAAQCTQFNIQASGATNIEVAVGDLYEPVGKERFDLITANPPFVPSPVDSLQFRDGGCSGEDVQRRIIAGLPTYLAPGGIAQIVTEFGERGDEPLADRLREWLDGAPMDIYILRLREHSATSYAIGHASGNDTFGVFLNSVRDWADNLRTQGYTRIVSVLLAFQWSDPTLGPSWTRSEESLPPHSNAGTEVEAAFLVERMVRKFNFHQILERSRLHRAGPIGLMEAWVLGGELRAKSQAKLLGKALPIMQWLDPVEREVLVLIDNSQTVPELLILARELNLDKETVFTVVGSLLRCGLVFLTSADD
jgi:hypothetical protein